MTKILISLSKKSKGKSKNPRSVFLSAFMTQLSKDPSIADSFFGKDKQAFKENMDDFVSKLLTAMPNKKSS